MEEALTSLLLADAALIALVGDRVHWVRQPADAGGFPYVNLQVVSGGVDYHLQGASGLRQNRVQVDAWAEDYAAQKAVERAILAAVSGYSGTVSGVDLHGVFVTSQRDLPDQTPDGERNLFRSSIDLEVSWCEPGA